MKIIHEKKKRERDNKASAEVFGIRDETVHKERPNLDIVTYISIEKSLPVLTDNKTLISRTKTRPI